MVAGTRDCQEQGQCLESTPGLKTKSAVGRDLSWTTNNTQTKAVLYLISLDAAFATSQHQGMWDSYAPTCQPHECFYDQSTPLGRQTQLSRIIRQWRVQEKKEKEKKTR